MATDIGPKIGMEGEAEFRRSLQDINTALKTMQAEGKALTATMQAETDAEKKNAAQKELLKRQIEAQKSALSKMKEALDYATKAYGENDQRTQKWKQAIYNATANLANMEHQLDQTEGEVREIDGDMEDAEETTQSWADVMKGSLLADAIKAGWNMLKQAVREVATAIKDAFVDAAAFADEIDTIAQKTGLSAQTIQEFKYMEELLDVSLETVTGSLTKLTRNMATAQEQQESFNAKVAEAEAEGKTYTGELGSMAAAFQNLGVEITDSEGNLRSAEDVFYDAIDALGKIENETERDAAAMQIFGKSAQELNPLIKAGADELNRLKDAANHSGYVLSGSMLSALKKSQDAMDSLGKKTEAVKNRFSAELAPGVTTAAKTMEKALDNPRVRAALQDTAQAIGLVIENLANLAGTVLPAFLTVLNGGDIRLATYTDAQLELSLAIGDTAREWEYLTSTYEENAQTILNETGRTEDLWKELQKLTDEEGNVLEADADRAAFILGQLNDALGTEYTMTGNQIEQYQTMRQEIENLIKEKEALALVDAKTESYTTAVLNEKNAAKDLALAYQTLQQTNDEVAAAQQKNNEAVAKYGMESTEAAYAGSELATAMAKQSKAQSDYNTMLGTYTEYQATIQQYEQAQAALLEGNYELAVQLLTGEMDYYQMDLSTLADNIAQKKELLAALQSYYEETNDQNVQDLIETHKEELAEMQAAQAERLGVVWNGLNQEFQATKQNSDRQTATVKQSLNQRKSAHESYKSAVTSAEQSITAISEQQAQIRLIKIRLVWQQMANEATNGGQNVGYSFGQGILNGINNIWNAIMEKAKSIIQNAVAAAQAAANNPGSGTTPGTGSGQSPITGPTDQTKGRFRDVLEETIGMTTEPTRGPAPTTSNETINLGGVSIYVDGSNVKNVDELADKVAYQLNQQIQRAKMARGY